jgi:hypothetical protein
MLVAEQPHRVDLFEQRLDQGVDPGGSLVLDPREIAVLQVTLLEGKPFVDEETEKDPAVPGQEQSILASSFRGRVRPRRANPLAKEEQEDAAEG